MSEHVLSQEEIDALLRGEAAAGETTMLDTEPLTAMFEAVLDHMVSVVSPVAEQQFETGRVVAELVEWEELRSQLITPFFARIDYDGDFSGMQLSIADGSTHQQLRAMGEEEPVTILNKMVLALTAGVENELAKEREGFQLTSNITSYEPLEESHDERIPLRSTDMCVVLQVSLQGDGGDVAWREVLPLDVATDIIELLSPSPESSEEAAAQPAPKAAATEPTAPVPATGDTGGIPAQTPSVPVAPAQFAPLGGPSIVSEAANIDLIMDVPLQVTVELGRKRMLVRDVLEMGKGSLIELEKLAGEPVDVFVNSKLIAKGEVVVIDENFGVKVTSIVTPVERLQNLQ